MELPKYQTSVAFNRYGNTFVYSRCFVKGWPYLWRRQLRLLNSSFSRRCARCDHSWNRSRSDRGLTITAIKRRKWSHWNTEERMLGRYAQRSVEHPGNRSVSSTRNHYWCNSCLWWLSKLESKKLQFVQAFTCVIQTWYKYCYGRN